MGRIRRLVRVLGDRGSVGRREDIPGRIDGIRSCGATPSGSGDDDRVQAAQTGERGRKAPVLEISRAVPPTCGSLVEPLCTESSATPIPW